MKGRRKKRLRRWAPWRQKQPGNVVSQATAIGGLEPLEPRLLLTTIGGGEIFEYIDATGQTIRIALEGDGVIEVLASDLDDLNQPLIGHLPGQILSSDFGRQGLDIAGGRGGQDGVDLIGSTPIQDAMFGPGNIAAPSDDALSLQAIASRDGLSGIGIVETYGFNVGTVTIGEADRLLVQLVQLDESDGDASVRATLHQASLSEDVMTDLNQFVGQVGAFAIDPTTGLGYAVNQVGGTSRLLQINRLSGNVSLIGPLLNTDAGVLSDVQAMAFDPTGQLFVLTNDYDGNPVVDTSGLPVNADNPPGTTTLDTALVRINKVTGSFNNSDAQSLLNGQGLETTFRHTAMTFDADGTILAAARVVDEEGTAHSLLHRLTFVPGAPTASVVGLGEIGIGIVDNLDYTAIDGLAFSVNGNGDSILVGVDNQVDEEGFVTSRLLSISPFSGGAAPISESGSIQTVGGLDSFTEAGDTRPLLFTVDNRQLIRGSSVTLPVDPVSGVSTVTNLLGADFKPFIDSNTDGFLFFTAAAGEFSTDSLYTLDVTETNRSAIQNSLTYVPGSFGEGGDADTLSVTSIAWDQTNTASADLVGYRVNLEDDSANLITINTSNTNFSLVGPTVTYNGEDLTTISGIAFAPDDGTQEEEFLLAIDNNGADSRLLRIRRSTGTTFELGPLADPDDGDFGDDGGEGPIRGEAIGGVTWHDDLPNPFTGEEGVLLGTDVASDELVYIEHRPRFPTADIFSLFVTQSSGEVMIAIAQVPALDLDDPGADRLMTPFEGSVGQFRVLSAQDGELILIDSSDGTGGVLIGARTEDIDPDSTEEDLIPIIETLLAQQLGTRAAGVDDFPLGPNDLAAGINVPENLLRYVSTNPDFVERLMGQNIDRTTGLAVTRDGLIYVVDGDRRDENGEAIPGDQIAFLDQNGEAGLPIAIVDALTGEALSDVRSITFGDVNLTGVESLFAIANAEDLRPFTSVGDLGGDFNIIALALDQDGLLGYLVNEDTASSSFELYEVQLDGITGEVISFTLIGDIVDNFGNRITDVSALDLNSPGVLFTTGFNIDAPRPTGSVGGDLGENFDIEGLTIDPTDPNTHYAINNDVSTLELHRLTRDPVTGEVDSFTLMGQIVDAGTGALIVGMAALAADSTGTLYGVGQDAESIVPSREIGDNAGDGNLGADFDARDVVVTPEGSLFFLNNNGGTLELYEATLDPLTEAVTAVTLLGPIVDLFDNAIDNIFSLDADPNGHIHGTGFNVDAPNPQTTVGGTLGGDFQIRALTMTTAGDMGYALDASTGSLELYELTRDAVGAVDSFVFRGALLTPTGETVGDVNGTDIDPSNTVDPDAGDDLFGIGLDQTLPIPTGPLASEVVGGGLGNDFDIQDLALLDRDQTLYALDDNGSTQDLYFLQRDPLTGNITAFDLVGQVTAGGNVILGLHAVDAAPFGGGPLYVIGLTGDSFLPTIDVGGDLDGNFNIVGITVTSTNDIFGLVNNGATLDLYEIVRSGIGTIAAFRLVGEARTDLGGAAGPETAILGGRALDTQPSTDALFFVGISADQLAPSQFLGSVGAPTDVVATVADDTAASLIYYLDDTGAGIQIIETVRDGDTGSLINAVPGGLVSTVADGTNPDLISNIDSAEFNEGNFLLVGRNVDVPTPAASIGNNLGNVFNLKDIAVSGAAGSERYYAVHFNGLNYDLYEIARNFGLTATVQGEISSFDFLGTITDTAGTGNPVLAIEAIEGDPSNADNVFVTGLEAGGIIDPAMDFNFYTIDTTTAAGGEVTATHVVDIALPPVGPPPDAYAFEAISGLAQDPANPDNFYFVLGVDDTTATATVGPGLFTLDVTTGAVAFADPATPVIPESEDIDGIDFSANGFLMLLDNGADGRELLRIFDLADIATTTAVIDDGVNENLRGLAFNAAGHAFSIFGSPAPAMPDEVWTDPIILWDVAVPDGTATALGAIVDPNNDNAVVEGVFAAIAMRDGRLYSVLRVDTDGDGLSDEDHLIELDPATGAMLSDFGTIDINNVNTLLDGFDFAVTGELIGLEVTDPTQAFLVAINLDDPGDSRALTDATVTAMDDDLRGFASDLFGRFYSLANAAGAEMAVSPSNQGIFNFTDATNSSEATLVNLISDASALIQQPVTDIFQAIAFYHDAFDATDPLNGTLFGVQEDFSAGNADRLVTFDLATGTFTRVDALNSAGAIEVGGIGTDIRAMDFTRDARLVAIDATSEREIIVNTAVPTASLQQTNAGTTNNLAGLASAVNSGDFFSVLLNAGISLDDQLLVSENSQALYALDEGTAQATLIGQITVNGLPISAEDSITALAFAPEQVIFAVLRDSSMAQDRLLSIDPFSGAAVDLGAIEVATISTRITAIDFRVDGRLVGYDDSSGGGRRLVLIDTSNPVASIALTAPGSIDGGLRGIASDIDGRFYSAQDTASPNEIWITPTQLFQVDQTNGEANFATTVFASPGVNISFSIAALAFDAAGTLFVILDGLTEQSLATVDPGTGVMTLIGPVRAGGESSSIAAMDFTPDGDLVALDDAIGGRRLIAIDLVDPASSVARTAVGDVDGGLRGYSSDASGRFYGIHQLLSPDQLWISGNGLFQITPVDTDVNGLFDDVFATQIAPLTTHVGLAITDDISATAYSRQLIELQIDLDALVAGASVPENTLSSGMGDGSVTVTVDPFGSFGSSVGGGTSDAIYDPVGGIGPAGTTFQSGVAIRTGGSTTFLTSGSIGTSSGGVVTAPTLGSNTAVVSTFSFGNLSIELVQALLPASSGTIQNGSILFQRYTVTNNGSSTADFDLFRYLDGDLYFRGDFVDDGGGRLIQDAVEFLFETESGGSSQDITTFVGITGEGGTIPATQRYEIDDFPELRDRIIGNFDLDDEIFGDTNGDDFIDVGDEYDVTLSLRNAFSVDPAATAVYTTTSVFGSATPEEALKPSVVVEGFFAIMPDATGNDTLVVIDPATGVVTDYGNNPVQVAGAAAQIEGLAEAVDGTLVALDRSQAGGGRLISLDVTHPNESVELTTPGSVDAGLDGLASDPAGRFFSINGDLSNDELWISSSEQELFTINADTGVATSVAVLTDSVTTDPVDSAVTGLAFDTGDVLHAIYDVNGVDAVATVDTGTAVATTIGSIRVDSDSDNVGDQDTDVRSMAFTSDGDLIAFDDGQPGGRRLIGINLANPDASTPRSSAGSVAVDLQGLTSDADSLFYSINIALGPDQLWVSGHDLFTISAITAVALPIGPIVVGNRAVTRTVKALAVAPDDLSIYAVTNGVGDRLLQLDPNSGRAIDRGLIEINGVGTGVQSMDFSDGGSLVAIDSAVGPLRLIVIDTLDPATSRELTAPGTIVAGLVGLTSDAGGSFYSVNGDLSPDELWISPGTTSILGTIDTTTGGFSATISVGAGLVGSAVAITFAPGDGSIAGQQGFYILDVVQEPTGENTYRIYEIDPSTGELVTTGDVLVDVSNSGTVDFEISAVDFHFNQGLFAHDTANGRLLDIDLDLSPLGTGLGTGTVNIGGATATPNGTLRPTVGAMAYDRSTDQFIASDNALSVLGLGNEGSAAESAVLMRLTGITSESAMDQSIGRFYIAGAATGIAHFSGSIDRFYAGWLVTGNTEGLPENSPPLLAGNFSVGGDVRDIISLGSIGTNNVDSLAEPDSRSTYVTGFDLSVRGKLGQLRTFDDFIGSTTILNDQAIDNFTALTAVQSEIEFISDESPGFLFEQFELFIAELFRNDTFEDAQVVGTSRFGTLGAPDTILISGQLQGDEVSLDTDYYAVALMAGQTIRVQLDGFFADAINVGIFDPDNRLIASDYENGILLSDAAGGEPIVFTTTKAGLYRFAIGAFLEDIQPSPVVGDDFSVAEAPYSLRIDGVGDIAAGGIVASGNIFGATAPLVFVRRGDLGALYSIGGAIFSDETLDLEADVLITVGNLRTIDAQQIGLISDVSTDLEMDVPRGGIGLLRASDPAGLLAVDTVLTPIGGNFQVIDAAGSYRGHLRTNKGVGVIRAGDMAADYSNISFELNVDRLGQDGIIDLIDVAGDFGDGIWGPSIDTGPGGNVRYLRVGGEVSHDRFYNTGIPTPVTLSPGTSYVHVDDSGGRISLVPVAVADSDLIDQPSLTLTTFGIRGSGGSVLVRVEVNGALAIYGDALGNGSPVEISELIVSAEGMGVVLEEDGSMLFETEATSTDDATAVNDNLTLTVAGNAPVDIFSIVSGTTVTTVDPGAPRAIRTATGATVQGGGFRSIVNTSGGELVSADIGGVGHLFNAGSIGLPKHHTSAVPYPRVDGPFAAIGFPYNQQGFGIATEGHVLSVTSNSAIGNLAIGAATGTNNAASLQYLGPNYDRIDDPAVFEGIAGPILVTGNVTTVDIGEGLAPSGTGNLADAGLYVGYFVAPNGTTTAAEGTINLVTNVNDRAGADIRGDIAAYGKIDLINLVDGAIVNVDIIAGGDPLQTREFAYVDLPVLENVLGFAFGGTTETLDSPIAEIGKIQLTGNGGIIGTFVRSADLGDVVIRNGFGIINSQFAVAPAGTIGSFITDGYGFDNFVIAACAKMKSITATGRGTLRSVLTFTPTVRYSETFLYDPIFGNPINDLNDLHLAKGTSVADPMRIEGIILDTRLRGSHSLGSITAYQILASEPVDPDFPLAANTSFRFANDIGTVTVLDRIDGMMLTTGELGRFLPRNSVSNLIMTVAGRIRFLSIRGSLLADSAINVMGPNGHIDRLFVMGDLDGNIHTDGYIGFMDIRGDLTGSVTINGTNRANVALNVFRIAGTLSSGSLEVHGSVGTMLIAGDLGDTGDKMVVHGDLRVLRIGSPANAGELKLDLTVFGNVLIVDVWGRISGQITITGNVTRFGVRGAGLPGAGLLTSEVQVFGSVRFVSIFNGDLGDGTGNGSITAGQDITVVQVINGDIAAGSSVASTFGNMQTVIVRGDLFGTIAARNGTIRVLSLIGSDIGGTGLVAAQDMTVVQVHGNLLAGAMINVTGLLRTLLVRGSVATGAAINTGSAQTVLIFGDMLGAMDLGRFDRFGTFLRVGGDLGGTTEIDGKARVFVIRDILAGATLNVGESLDLLYVLSTMRGNIFAKSTVRTVVLGAMDGAVFTSAQDVGQIIVRGAIDRSLIQIGARPGDDGIYATASGAIDQNETATPASLNRITTGSILESIIAAGRDIFALTVFRGVTDSSISSGMNLGVTAIGNVVAGTLDLSTAVGRNAARSAADRLLGRGDVTRARAATWTGSVLSAGVDAGTTGDFTTPLVYRQPADGGALQIGGDSHITYVSGTFDAASAVLADAGIGGIPGGTVNANVTYDINDVAGTAPDGKLLETLRGTASSDVGATWDGVTVSVTGTGTVELRDDLLGDGALDTLVIQGQGPINVTVTSTGGTNVNRVLTTDDTIVDTFDFNGTLAGLQGAGAIAPDLLIDVADSRYVINEVADGVNGSFGGDVAELFISRLGEADLKVLGQIETLSVDLASGNGGLLTTLGPTPGAWISAMASNGGGQTFVVDEATGNLVDVDPATGAINSQSPVVNIVDGTAVTLTSLNFTSGGTLIGTATLPVHNPTQLIGPLADVTAPVQSDLQGLTVLSDSDGRTLAIERVNGVDELAVLGQLTGGVASVGTFVDVFGHPFVFQVLQLAGTVTGGALALVSDADGEGTNTAIADGAAIATISLTPNINGALILSDPNNVSDGPLPLFDTDNGNAPIVVDAALLTFTAMAVRPSDGTVFAVIRDLVANTDRLVTIDTATGAVSNAGTGPSTVTYDPGGGATDTHIIGMGFETLGGVETLVVASQATHNQLLAVTLPDPLASAALVTTPVTVTGSLDDRLDAFAVGGSTYAYDDDQVGGGLFVMNPQGDVPAFVTVNTTPNVGGDIEVTPSMAIAVDDLGTPIADLPRDIAINATDQLFALTTADTLLRFNFDTAIEPLGIFETDLGTLTETRFDTVISLQSFAIDASDILIGLDAQRRRLLTIDSSGTTPGTVPVTARTESGAIVAQLSAMAFDPITDTLQAADAASGTFRSFAGTTNSVLRGLTADSVNNLTFGLGGSSGRFVAEGNMFNVVNTFGNFSGTLRTAGDINTHTHDGGVFTGALLAGNRIGNSQINNATADTTSIFEALTIEKLEVTAGDFSGTAAFKNADTINISGLGGETAYFSITDTVGTLTYGGDFDGVMQLGGVSSALTVEGTLAANASINIENDANRVTIGNTATGSLVAAEAAITSLNVPGTHQGVIAADDGVDRATFGDVANGILVSGLDATRLEVLGNAVSGVFAFGVRIGSDHVYNTNDDVITGGSLGSAIFRNLYQDSVVSAGVLPNANAVSTDPQNRPDTNAAYISNSGNFTDVTLADPVEAGGILNSTIDNVLISGNVTNTFLGAGGLSAIVSADGLGRVTAGPAGPNLFRRVHADPAGAPQVIGNIEIIDATEMQLFFSEPLSTGTLVLAQDIDGNGFVDNPADIPGSVIVEDENGVINDVQLDYFTTTDDSGDAIGVLRLLRQQGFIGTVTVTLIGAIVTQDQAATTATVTDRSALRSTLRDFNQDGVQDPNEDRLGTILDGDGDGFEGGNFNSSVFFGDAADTFTEALETSALDLDLDGLPMRQIQITQAIESSQDADIFRFAGNAFEFFRFAFDGVNAQYALFFQDDQGTPLDIADDSFEMVTRWNTNSRRLAGTDTVSNQTYELPETGTYFLVVSPLPSIFAQTGTYEMTLTMAASDDELDGILDGDSGLDPDDVIAYVSNTVGENNNLLDANTPKQLVYLNFDGGMSTETNEGNVTVDPFDAGAISSALVGLEDELINGSTEVVGILQRFEEIYTNIPATQTGGPLNVQEFSAADLTGLGADIDNLPTGITFTTANPADFGLDPADEFTTIFIGTTNALNSSFGNAALLDIANMSKGDEAILFIENFDTLLSPIPAVSLANEIALAIANVSAHELGHMLGFSHTESQLIADDPDNDLLTPDDSNSGFSVMATGWSANENTDTVQELGTAAGQQLRTRVFPHGRTDTVTNLVRWLI